STEHYVVALVTETHSPHFIYLLFFNVPSTTAIYTLSLHDALPISPTGRGGRSSPRSAGRAARRGSPRPSRGDASEPPRSSPGPRSEEHTSELQSRENLVCRLLLEKKKQRKTMSNII